MVTQECENSLTYSILFVYTNSLTQNIHVTAIYFTLRIFKIQSSLFCGKRKIEIYLVIFMVLHENVYITIYTTYYIIYYRLVVIQVTTQHL